MSLYSGNEFDQEKGSQGNLIKFVWKKIYSKFLDVQALIATALQDFYTKSEIDGKVSTLTASISNEANSRATADNDLQAQIIGLRTITPFNPLTDTFPTVRADGQPFNAGNFIQITASGTFGGVDLKAGDVIIATVNGASSLADFADVESNVNIATSAIYGTVKLLANVAAYQGVGNDSAVISKSLLQSILGQLQSDITTAMSTADTDVINQVTTAYQQAIADALANYYTKTEIDTLLDDKMSKAKGVELAGIIQNEVYAAMKRLSASIKDFVVKKVGVFATITANLSVIVANTISVKYIINPIGTHMNGLVLSQSATSFADVTASNKADFDYFLFSDASSLTIIFNSDIFTPSEVANMTIGYTEKRAEPTMADFLAPTANGGVGNDNGTTKDILPDYILTLQV